MLRVARARARGFREKREIPQHEKKIELPLIKQQN
jgi:hypothetical protein